MSEDVARLCPACKKKHFIEPTSRVKYKICDSCGWEFTYDQSLPCLDDNDSTTNQYAQTDIINHPEHYAGSIECIDAMIAAYGKEQVAIFCKLCAFKYLWRLEKKGDCKVDAGKAQWYLDKYKEMKR
jgi:hypothetical protein